MSVSRSIEYLQKRHLTWVPSDCKRLIPKSTEDNCRVLAKTKYKTIFFSGDSLVRGLWQGFAALTNGDFEHGSTINTAPKRAQEKCPTLQQYWQMECRAFVGKTTDALLHPPCEGLQRPQDIPYLEYCEKAKAEHGEYVVGKIKKKGLFEDKNALILVGVALHANLKGFKVKRDYIEPMYKAWEQAGKKATIVWLSMHSQDRSKKSEHFQRSQNDERVAAFNGPINRLVRSYGWKVFDTFALTQGAYSYDGTHYDTAVNYLKAAYIMEWLENNQTSIDG